MTYCGDKAPTRNPVVIAGNKVRVTFESDYNKVYYGFKMTWTAFINGKCCDIRQKTLDYIIDQMLLGRAPLLPQPSRSGCGGQYKLSSKGSFKSHQGYNGKSEYPNYTYCRWLLSVPSPNKVRLQFEDFNLERERNSHCDDYVTVSSNTLHLSNSLPLDKKSYCNFV